MSAQDFFKQLPSLNEQAPIPTGTSKCLAACMTHCGDSYCDCKCDDDGGD